MNFFRNASYSASNFIEWLIVKDLDKENFDKISFQIKVLNPNNAEMKLV